MMGYFQRKDELLPKEILPFKSEFRKEFEYICRMVIGKQAKEKVVPKRPSKGQMYAQEFRTGFMKPSGAIMPKKN